MRWMFEPNVDRRAIAAFVLVGCIPGTAEPTGEPCVDTIAGSFVEDTITLTYDGDGRRLDRTDKYGGSTYAWQGDVVTETQNVDNGSLNWTIVTTFSDRMPVSVISFANDEWESEVRYTWDIDGYLTGVDYMLEPGGLPVRSESWTLDASGRPIESWSDGELDLLYTWSDDLLVRIERPFDGSTKTIAWTLDAEGRPSRSDEDEGDDGVVDRSYTWTWDGPDRLASSATSCVTWTWTWDDDGRVIESTSSTSCGHEPGSYVTEYALGCAGPGYERPRLLPDPYADSRYELEAALALLR